MRAHEPRHARVLACDARAPPRWLCACNGAVDQPVGCTHAGLAGRPAAEVLADASYGYRPHLLDRLPFDRTLFGVHLARKAKERDGVFLVSQT